MRIIIDENRCSGCGNCMDVCPSDVFGFMEDIIVVADAGDCVECCACVEGCPEDAIEHPSC